MRRIHNNSLIRCCIIPFFFILVVASPSNTWGEFLVDVAECILGTGKPDEGESKKSGEMKIDAVCQNYGGSYQSCFGKKGAKSIPKQLLAKVNITIDFAKPVDIYPDITAVYSNNDFTSLWQNAHQRETDGYTAFVYSGREHVDGVLGRTSRPGGDPGTQMNFYSEHISFIAFRTMSFLEVPLPGIWGYVMTHECGHLYARLNDVSDEPQDHDGNQCVMTQLNDVSDEKKKELTNTGCYFCKKCKGFIEQAMP